MPNPLFNQVDPSPAVRTIATAICRSLQHALAKHVATEFLPTARRTPIIAFTELKPVLTGLVTAIQIDGNYLGRLVFQHDQFVIIDPTDCGTFLVYGDPDTTIEKMMGVLIRKWP